MLLLNKACNWVAVALSSYKIGQKTLTFESLFSSRAGSKRNFLSVGNCWCRGVLLIFCLLCNQFRLIQTGVGCIEAVKPHFTPNKGSSTSSQTLAKLEGVSTTLPRLLP